MEENTANEYSQINANDGTNMSVGGLGANTGCVILLSNYTLVLYNSLDWLNVTFVAGTAVWLVRIL